MADPYCIRCGLPHPAGKCKRDADKVTGLTDRIAAAICNWYYGENAAWEYAEEAIRCEWRGCAGALIDELGLRLETAHAWNSNASRVTGTRWVTAWERGGDG